MIKNELKQLEKITDALSNNGYLIDQTKEWQAAFDAVPDLIYVVNLKQEVKFINRNMEKRLGLVNKREVVDKMCFEMLGFDAPVLPICEDPNEQDMCKVCLNYPDCESPTGDICKFGVQLIPKLEGAFEFTRSTIKTASGKILGFICVLRDVTETRMIEKASNSLLGLYKMYDHDEEALARYILEEIVSLTDSEVGYLHFVDDNGLDDVRLDLFIWSKETVRGCKAEPTMHYPLCDAGIWADSVREGRALIHNDYPNEPTAKGLPEGHFPLKRHMSVPIYDGMTIVAVAGVGNKIISYTDLDITQTSITLSSMWNVLKQRRVERELVKSERAIADLTKLTKTAIYEIDFKSDRFTFVNDAMCEHTGYTREEFFSMSAASILTEQSQLKLLGRLEAFGRGEAVPNSVEYQCKAKDGSYIWVLCSTDFRLNDDGMIVGARVVAIDITEQRGVEDKVRNILEASPFGVHMYRYENDDLIFVGANPAADKILEVDNKIYYGLPLKEAFPDLDEQGIPEKYINVMKTGATWSADIDYTDDKIGGSFEVHAFKTSENTMAAMFKEVGMEHVLRTKVDELKNRLQATERECKLLADHLTT